DAEWEASLTGDNSDTLTASKSLEEMRDQDATGSREDTEEGAVAKEDNPLEVDVDFDQLFDDTEPRLNGSSIERYEEEGDFTTYTARQESSYEVLGRQIALSALNEREQEVAHFIVGLLDDDGYLHTDLEEIAEEFDMELCDVEDVLQTIQTFDPTGIGARS